jgi:hypothetical protein
MTRKVDFSQKTGDEIAELRQQAKLRGDEVSFRNAWIAIWKALHERPLPPDESDAVFGEIRYHAKHAPHHVVCEACMRPLLVRFAVFEQKMLVDDQPVTLVIISKVTSMS